MNLSKILNIVLILVIVGVVVYGFNKFKSFFMGLLGFNEDSETKLIEILTNNPIEPDPGNMTDGQYENWIKIIKDEFDNNVTPTMNKEKIVDFLEGLKPEQLKHFIEKFGVIDYKSNFGFFSSKVTKRNLMDILTLEYDKGIWGAVSGSPEQRERLGKAFARIGVILNF